MFLKENYSILPSFYKFVVALYREICEPNEVFHFEEPCQNLVILRSYKRYQSKFYDVKKATLLPRFLSEIELDFLANRFLTPIA